MQLTTFKPLAHFDIHWEYVIIRRRANDIRFRMYFYYKSQRLETTVDEMHVLIDVS